MNYSHWAFNSCLAALVPLPPCLPDIDVKSKRNSCSPPAHIWAYLRECTVQRVLGSEKKSNRLAEQQQRQRQKQQQQQCARILHCAARVKFAWMDAFHSMNANGGGSLTVIRWHTHTYMDVCPYAYVYVGKFNYARFCHMFELFS